MTPPDPLLVERFTRDWYAATGSACADCALIALSGGPDSTALLLLRAAAKSLGQPHAATVDHGLRATSSAEAGAAADLCRAAGVPHAILSGPLPDRAGPTANLSARARALRYSLLEEHAEAIGARWIVTAHHADDQLETLVMRLNRGSGVRGLAGIRGRGGERIVRPLLGWRHAELAALVEACGVSAINDPSNVDDRFDRARLRKVLARNDWIDPVMVSRSVAALGEADEAVEWMADRLEGELCQYGEGQALLKSFCVPAELARRLVERCLRHVDPGISIRGGDLTRLVAALQREDPATLGRVRCGIGFTAAPFPQMLWTFQQAPPHRSN